MGDDRVDRRAILGAGAGLLVSLAGCGGLFIEPETTATPGSRASTPTPTETPTTTPAPTAPGESTTDGATRTATATTTPVPSDAIEIRNRQLAIERTTLEQFAIVTYRFDVENTGDRTIRDVEFRIRVRYEHEEYSRIVATAYPRFWFDETEDEDDEGLESDETERVIGRLRFERDGRAEESTAVDRFDLDLTIRRIRYL
jgi:hypothetical protein